MSDMSLWDANQNLLAWLADHIVAIRQRASEGDALSMKVIDTYRTAAAAERRYAIKRYEQFNTVEWFHCAHAVHRYIQREIDDALA